MKENRIILIIQKTSIKKEKGRTSICVVMRKKNKSGPLKISKDKGQMTLSQTKRKILFLPACTIKFDVLLQILQSCHLLAVLNSLLFFSFASMILQDSLFWFT